jgi:choline dehydrogenase
MNCCLVLNNIEPNWNSLVSNATYDAEQRKLYDIDKKGAYTLTRTLSTNLALPPLQNTTKAYKDIVKTARDQDALESLHLGTDSTVVAGYRAQREEILKQLEGPNTPVGMIHWGTSNSVTLYFQKPLSRGEVIISSTDPLSPPSIDFRSVTDPIDLDVAVALFLKNREIMAAPAMKALGSIERAPFGDGITDKDTLKRIIRDNLVPSTAHECCTAAMMPREMGGVLDPEMKVYGVQQLRVIDTSYWPVVLTAAPTGTMYATGEKVRQSHRTTFLMSCYHVRC